MEKVILSGEELLIGERWKCSSVEFIFFEYKLLMLFLMLIFQTRSLFFLINATLIQK